MKKLLSFFLFMLFAVAVFAQQIIVVSNGDTTVATLPSGATIGEGQTYSPESLGSGIQLVVFLAFALINSALVYLSYLVPKLRNLGPILANPKVRALAASILTAILGWFAKFDEGTTQWLTYFIGQVATGVFGASGLYDLILKPLLGKTKAE